MRVYDVGGVSDAELIKTKPKTPARVAPPLTAAEQRHVAQRLSEVHADLALWRACERKACGRRRRCSGDVDQCGARRAADSGPACMKFWRRSEPGKAPRAAARVAERRAMPPRQRYVFGDRRSARVDRGAAGRRQLAHRRRGAATVEADAAVAAAACR